MAVLSHTKLNAVNFMLEAINEEPVSALDPGGDSIEGAAEAILDRVSRDVQARGWPGNVLLNSTQTSAGGGPDPITLPSDTLWIRGSNPIHRDRFFIVGDEVYDQELNSTDFGSTGVEIVIDIVKELDYEDCFPALKHLIMLEAALLFQRRRRNSRVADASLTEERNMAELMIPRLPEVVGINPRPIILDVPRQDQGAQ